MANFVFFDKPSAEKIRETVQTVLSRTPRGRKPKKLRGIPSEGTTANANARLAFMVSSVAAATEELDPRKNIPATQIGRCVLAEWVFENDQWELRQQEPDTNQAPEELEIECVTVDPHIGIPAGMLVDLLFDGEIETPYIIDGDHEPPVVQYHSIHDYIVNVAMYDITKPQTLHHKSDDPLELRWDGFVCETPP